MADSVIDMNIPVNEMVARHPETMAVFKRFGLDTCCGGGAPIAAAAQRDGAKVEDLEKALQDAIAAAGVA